MGSSKKIEYDNLWILDRWDDVRNWLTLCKQYNKEHGTDICYNTFKAHCNRELGLNYHYTEEQNEWLRQNFPKLGRKKAAVEFEKKFCQYRSPEALKVHCNRNLGLRVTAERRSEIPKENSGRYHEVGTRMVVGNNGLCEKTESGWERIADNAIGKAPKGHRTIHLDGDVMNNEPSNLRHVSFSDCGLMTTHKLWSEDPTITSVGLEWCKFKHAHDMSKAKNNE